MAVASTLLQNDKLRKITIERVEKFLSHEYWTDVNLWSKLYAKTSQSAVKLGVWSPPGEVNVNHTDRTKPKEALTATYKPVERGQSFGPSWATHWFKVEIEIPADFVGEEVHLIWDNGSEALIFDSNAVPIQGLYGGGGDDRRQEYILTKRAHGGEKYLFYIEMACNGLFGNPADGGFLKPPDANKSFSLKTAELRTVNRVAWDLFFDFETVLGMAKEMSKKSNRAWQAAATLEKMIQAAYVDDNASLARAREIAKKFLSQHNGDSQHLITATGHCHIDTAWLWTYSETRRKVARSWSTQLELAKHFPGYTFAASQAQQFEWLKQGYPELFKSIQDASVKGSFYPCGGTWVEMDCNIPSGESLVRQFLFGQRFFESEFGHKCSEFWLPDTFGYSSQLPQIMKSAGVKYFLTQKLSWNLINKFPHNTFFWQGLDGTKVLSHFPPADTYCARGKVQEILFTVENFKNKGTSNSSMMLFGIGDGGGGPQLQMLERLSRSHDVDQLPKVEFNTPRTFFERITKEPDHPTWVGELYFELHRGTYTTHAAVKRGNRKNEFALRSTELLTALSTALKGTSYPQNEINRKGTSYTQEEINRLWKLLLLNQFHDVIPGTSIGAAYHDTREHYADIAASTTKMINDATASLIGAPVASAASVVAVNALSWPRAAVVELPAEVAGHQSVSGSLDEGKRSLAIVEAPSVGYEVQTPKKDAASAVHATAANDTFVLENASIRAVIDKTGAVTSVVYKKLGREVLATGAKGNRFCIFEDMPFFWDAWDCMEYHLDKRVDLLGDATTIKIEESGPLRASLSLTTRVSATSSIRQVISLDALSDALVFDTLVDWHENRKFLKVEFPVAILSETATYHTQYGVSKRPTHKNTSWDIAKFEVCGHHWADLSERGFGAAVLSDCKYGFAVHDNVLRLSLLRSSKQYDPSSSYFKRA